MVSQFEILTDYTQINYQGRPVRVTSLRYGDLIKWFTNRGDGLPAYIIIDMVSQEAEIVRLQEGMKYTTAEHLTTQLLRAPRARAAMRAMTARKGTAHCLRTKWK